MLKQLRALGKKVYLVTNSSDLTRAEFADHARQMGFEVDADQIISTAWITAQYLKQRHFNRKVYVVGEVGISKELELVGIQSFGVGPDPMIETIGEFRRNLRLETNVGAVVAGFDEHLSYPKLVKASSYLANDPTCFLMGTCRDNSRMQSGDDSAMPNEGTVVRAVEACSHRSAKIMGKPYELFRRVAVNEMPFKVTSRFLMVGDRLDIDIMFGNRNGMRTLLVESGQHKIEKVRETLYTLNSLFHYDGLENEVPEFHLRTLGDLLDNY